MSARILVVDDVEANVLLLKSNLEAEYFEVLTAHSGREALSVLANEPVDIILLDVMMPEMDGFEVCQKLRADAALSHIPVIMITALDKPQDRNHGLSVGADDFLTKPVNQLQLFARVKSLVRLKLLTDELRLRAVTTRDLAVRDLLNPTSAHDSKPKVLVIDQHEEIVEQLRAIFETHTDMHHVRDAAEGYGEAVAGDYDCAIISSQFTDFDALRLCAQVRSHEKSRFLPIILSCVAEGEKFISRALEIGVNDYVVCPLDDNEVRARVNTQVRRKRYHEGLRINVTESVEHSVTDGLTGLNNRRYLDQHLSTLVERVKKRGQALSLLVTDIDKFKNVNDEFGHPVGDTVLKEFSRRLRANIRGIDLACRYGGEEFVVVMPDTDAETAREVAERLREGVAKSAFALDEDVGKIDITVSVGVGTLSDDPKDTAESLMKRADDALYKAKRAGRNRVIGQAA